MRQLTFKRYLLKEGDTLPAIRWTFLPVDLTQEWGRGEPDGRWSGDDTRHPEVPKMIPAPFPIATSSRLILLCLAEIGHLGQGEDHEFFARNGADIVVQA